MSSVSYHKKRIEECLKKNIQINSREAKIEADYILKFALKKPSSFFISNQKTNIEKTQEELISSILKKRIKREPLAYIFKEWDFYGETFYLDKNSLIPRQDTELMVDLVLSQFDKKSKLNILDLGTGSGVIGITLSKFFPNSIITISDISPKALKVANKNIKKHKVSNVHSIESNWFVGFKEKEFFDLILTNPPYIAKGDVHLTNLEINYEPSNALVSANNGFSDIFKIIDSAPNFLKPKGKLFIEHGYTQANKVKNYLQKKYFDTIKQHRDINHKIRVTSGSKIKV
ncbi:peptide chain release factor N(5)-glutamine methyltransferase [Methylophilaceae bacterium]|nr:peptide chain release factor N(5)-glutamine methyltransferase [Methylophilaceae bacterium]